MKSRKLWLNIYVITIIGLLAFEGKFDTSIGIWLCTAAGIYSGANVTEKIKTNGK